MPNEQSATVESLKSRKERFQKAKDFRNLWSTELEQAYRFLMPNRIGLTDSNMQLTSQNQQTRGEDRMRRIFDPTGIEALSAFANNLQMSAMPSFQRWAEVELSPWFLSEVEKEDSPLHQQFGPITPQTIEEMREQLNRNNQLLFSQFEKSRLDQVINESFHDVGISTGVMILNEGSDIKPLEFVSIPGNTIIIEGGLDQSLANFWFPIRMKGRNILEKWPQAEFSSNLLNRVNKSPEESVDLIEATLFYPDNPPGQKFYYFVMTTGDSEDGEEIVGEWREIDPWIAFRGSKSPGEVYGRGPALTALPTVRELNKMAEWALRSAQLTIAPTYMAANTGDVNLHTLRINPGAIIPFSPEFMAAGDPIRPLATGGQLQISLEMMESKQNTVRDIMFANPIGPQGSPGSSATETSIINNNWIRKNAGFFSRLSVELFPQLVDKSLYILTKRNIMPMMMINGAPVPLRLEGDMFKLKFTTPMAMQQDQQDFANIEQAVGFAMNTFGGVEGLLSLNIGELPETAYRKLNIPANLINSDFKTSPLIKMIQQSIQQQPQQPQPGQVPPGAAPVGAPAPIGAAQLSATPIVPGGQ